MPWYVTVALVGMLISIAMLLSYTQRERRAPRLVGVAAVALPLAFVGALAAWAITGG
ncbi:hypothetical protein [Salinispora oceanensis]|uniref:hypothetical protein n=1 Tax=Salinispora oceanensis TaxID=1050199 RepID=UPI00037D0C5B|nr:hypothetical protein [Salinispora oceanensis]